jgi:hypothetical protein
LHLGHELSGYEFVQQVLLYGEWRFASQSVPAVVAEFGTRQDGSRAVRTVPGGCESIATIRTELSILKVGSLAIGANHWPFAVLEIVAHQGFSHLHRREF